MRVMKEILALGTCQMKAMFECVHSTERLISRSLDHKVTFSYLGKIT